VTTGGRSRLQPAASARATCEIKTSGGHWNYSPPFERLARLETFPRHPHHRGADGSPYRCRDGCHRRRRGLRPAVIADCSGWCLREPGNRRSAQVHPRGPVLHPHCTREPGLPPIRVPLRQARRQRQLPPCVPVGRLLASLVAQRPPLRLGARDRGVPLRRAESGPRHHSGTRNGSRQRGPRSVWPLRTDRRLPERPRRKSPVVRRGRACPRSRGAAGLGPAAAFGYPVKDHPGPAASRQAATTTASPATHTATATDHQVSKLPECCFVSPDMLVSLLGRWQWDLALLNQSTTR
jgi:hypothetical protein